MGFRTCHLGRPFIRKRYTNPPTSICICFWVTSFLNRRSDRANRYLATFEGLAEHTPSNPSNHAPWSSPLLWFWTPFFTFRGTDQSSYFWRSSSTSEGQPACSTSFEQILTQLIKVVESRLGSSLSLLISRGTGLRPQSLRHQLPAQTLRIETLFR